MKRFKVLLSVLALSGTVFTAESYPAIRVIRASDRPTHVAKWGALGGLGGALFGFFVGLGNPRSSKWTPTLIGAVSGGIISAVAAYFDAIEHSPERHLQHLRELKMRLDSNPELKISPEEIVNRVKLVYAATLWPLAASRSTLLNLDESCWYGLGRVYAINYEPEVLYDQREISDIGQQVRNARSSIANRLHSILNSTEWNLEVKRYQQHLEEQERQRLKQAQMAQQVALEQQKRRDEERRHKEKIALKKYENGLPLTAEERELLNLPR